MIPSFSTFSNSLLFNYWNADRDSILNDFLKDLKDCYLSFPNTQIVDLLDNIIEISTTDDNYWPSSVFLKTGIKSNDEHLLIFNTTELFF
ncbi:MAG: hypothetical protein B7Y37_05620 [Sphingobacteriia bacterium 28-36-52]|nr:MAG: hypothetical protein B7Y37_05620 [Sphingobacteriia bacterium 28-36-52]